PRLRCAFLSWVVSGWHGIVAETSQPLKTHLKNAHLSLGGDNRLLIVVGDGVAYDYLRDEENQRHVENMISNFVQKEVSVQIQNLVPGRQFEESYVDLAKVINMDIEIEDE
ncbi:MAG: DNA polymerase III subunit gamma/tau, partial [Lachnospiraceae bacterium]|nr:DNA polymerase III subunit gamma/tau [Lachnospiraceae bacterium]